MFKLLLKTRIDMFFTSLGQGMGKKKKKNISKGTKIALICLFAFLAVYIIGAMFILFMGATIVSADTENEHVPFVLALIVALSITLFGSIFPTKTQIFDSKDNELLLSMPIEPKYIFTSRLFFLLLVNYALESIIMIPAIIAYAINIGFTFVGFVFTLIIYLALPFLTLALSSLIAWIVSLIASKMKSKTLITVLLFTVFFGAYMYFMGMVGYSTGSGEEIDLSGLANIPVIGWGAEAMAYGKAVPFLLFFLCCAVPAVIAYALLNRSFISILTTRKGRVKTKYKEKSEKADSVYKTLVKKELKKFTSSSAYMLNAGMGAIMTVLFTVMIAVVAAPLLTELSESGSDLGNGEFFNIDFLIPVIAFAVVAFGSSMIIISAPSISIEDRNLWILQSLPIRPIHVLLAKLSAHLLIAIPCGIICSVILSVFLKISFINTVLLVLGTAALNGAFAYFGLFLGLHFPKFDWENENIAVKQGFAVFGAMMGSMVWSFIIIAAAFLLSFLSYIFAMIAVITVNGLVCFGIHMYFIHGGEKRFAFLKQ